MSDIIQFPDLGGRLTQKIIKCAIEVHKELGPGLLESVYEHGLAYELEKSDLKFERQKEIPILYKGHRLKDCFRADFIVENQVILELKTVEKLIPLHHAQILSYIKLTKLDLGLLLNFNAPLMKDGIKRVAWSERDK